MMMMVVVVSLLFTRHIVVVCGMCSLNEFLELILSWIKVVCDIYGEHRTEFSSFHFSLFSF